MKKSLLQIVQNILNDLDSDEVNSIYDTVESEQIAEIVEQTYNDIISTRNWPHLSKLIQLESSTTQDKPTHCKLPESVKELEFINYDTRKEDDDDLAYRPVEYLYPDQFLYHTNQRRSSADYTDIINNDDGLVLLINNNEAPKYWTSFDDEYIVFDSYNKSMESTIQNSKMQVKAYVTPKWETKDSFIPDLPAEAFSKLIAEAKSTAFLVIKQMSNEKAEQISQRQSRWLSRKAWSAKGGVRYPDYGRKGRGRASKKDITFQRDNY